MLRTIIPAIAALALFSADELKTQYSKEHPIRVEVESTQTMETTAMEITRDGEPMEGRGMGRGGSEASISYTYVDRIGAMSDGSPTQLEREFEEVGGVSTMAMGEESRESDRESPLDGETLVLEVDDEGDTIATLKGDDNPEPASILKGHSMTLPLDGLLPDGEAKIGHSWEPEGAAVLAALGLDVMPALFPRPERGEGNSERGERGGRGGRGPRGGGGGSLGFLREAEWETEATWVERTQTHDGHECIVIELTFEAEGEMPEFGGRGRDREQSEWGLSRPESIGSSVVRVDNTYEIEVSGELLYSLEAQRPVKLTLEGEITQEMSMERDTPDFSMSIYRLQEGSLSHTIVISNEDD